MSNNDDESNNIKYDEQFNIENFQDAMIKNEHKVRSDIGLLSRNTLK